MEEKMKVPPFGLGKRLVEKFCGPPMNREVRGGTALRAGEMARGEILRSPDESGGQRRYPPMNRRSEAVGRRLAAARTGEV